MLKGMEFLLKKSRGKVEVGKELSSPAPVILGPVPRIFWQRVINQVNKFALLLQRSMFTEDSRDKPENDGYWGRWFSVCCMFVKQMYHSGSSANELTLKAKDDVPGWCQGRWFSAFCKFFKYPSPGVNTPTSPAGGEVTRVFSCPALPTYQYTMKSGIDHIPKNPDCSDLNQTEPKSCHNLPMQF